MKCWRHKGGREMEVKEPLRTQPMLYMAVADPSRPSTLTVTTTGNLSAATADFRALLPRDIYSDSDSSSSSQHCHLPTLQHWGFRDMRQRTIYRTQHSLAPLSKKGHANLLAF